jgi:4-amino-4-deoxy-L-arabinose transferase-like glycosyltransferase
MVFHLGKDLMDEQRAAVGTLLLVGIAGFSWRSIEFNHNIAQMPFFVAAVWSIWQATVDRSTFWWVAAGICAALGFYAKLSMAVLLAPASTMVFSRPRGTQIVLHARPLDRGDSVRDSRVAACGLAR